MPRRCFNQLVRSREGGEPFCSICDLPVRHKRTVEQYMKSTTSDARTWLCRSAQAQGGSTQGSSAPRLQVPTGTVLPQCGTAHSPAGPCGPFALQQLECLEKANQAFEKADHAFEKADQAFEKARALSHLWAAPPAGGQAPGMRQLKPDSAAVPGSITQPDACTLRVPQGTRHSLPSVSLPSLTTLEPSSSSSKLRAAVPRAVHVGFECVREGRRSSSLGLETGGARQTLFGECGGPREEATSSVRKVTSGVPAIPAECRGELLTSAEMRHKFVEEVWKRPLKKNPAQPEASPWAGDGRIPHVTGTAAGRVGRLVGEVGPTSVT